MTLNGTFEHAVAWLFFPTAYPLVVAVCFVVTGVLFARANQLSAAVFGFSVPFAMLWPLIVASLLWHMTTLGIWDHRFSNLILEMGVAGLLFVTVAILSARALLLRTSLAHPGATASALIIAHTLHVHIVFSWLFLVA